MTVYSDIASAYCSNAALALFGQCTALPIKSFTVDCQINGTNTGNYTTIYPSSGETSTPSATPPTTLSFITGTNPLISTNSSSSSLAPSSSSQTSSASSTSAPPPSPSPSQAPKQGDGNGGLSRAGRIGLGTGLGVLGLVGMVVYGAQKWRKRRARQSGSSDINMNAIQPRQEQSTTLKSESESSVNGNIRQSDTFSCANSSFRSIPKERPGKLYE